MTLDAPFCPGPGANTLGYTTRTGLSDDVHSWSVVSGPPITGSTTGSKATVTLPTPGTYTYRVNRQLGYLRTTPPPTAVVLYPFGDTDITVVVTAAPPPDTTPDAFSFAAVGNLPRMTARVSPGAGLPRAAWRVSSMTKPQ